MGYLQLKRHVLTATIAVLLLFVVVAPANAIERTITTKPVSRAQIGDGAAYWIGAKSVIWRSDLATGVTAPFFALPRQEIHELVVHGGVIAVKFSRYDNYEWGPSTVLAIDTATGISRELVNESSWSSSALCGGGVVGLDVTLEGEVILTTESQVTVPGANCRISRSTVQVQGHRKDGTTRLIRSTTGSPHVAVEEDWGAIGFILGAMPLDVEANTALMHSPTQEYVYLLENLASGVSTPLYLGSKAEAGGGSLKLMPGGAIFAWHDEMSDDPVIFPTPMIPGSSVTLRRKRRSDEHFAPCGSSIIEVSSRLPRRAERDPYSEPVPRKQRIAIYNLQGQLVKNVPGKVRAGSELIGCDSNFALFKWDRPYEYPTPTSGGGSTGGGGAQGVLVTPGKGSSTAAARKRGPAQRLFVMPLQ